MHCRFMEINFFYILFLKDNLKVQEPHSSILFSNANVLQGNAG